MGQILEVMGCANHVSWLPTEDPTFVIPTSVQLSERQLQELQDAGITPGTAFCLTNEGTLAPPESKRFKLKMAHSNVSIVTNSVRLVEIANGKYFVEFLYCASKPMDCVISFNVKDNSSSSKIDITNGLIWDSFVLEPGSNMKYVSSQTTTTTATTNTTKTNSTIDYSSLHVCINRGSVVPNVYDLVISIVPSTGGTSGNRSGVSGGGIMMRNTFNNKPTSAANSVSGAKPARSLFQQSVTNKNSIATTPTKSATPPHKLVTTDSDGQEEEEKTDSQLDSNTASDNTHNATHNNTIITHRITPSVPQTAITNITSDSNVKSASSVLPLPQHFSCITREVWYFRVPYVVDNNNDAHSTSDKNMKSTSKSNSSSAKSKSSSLVQFPTFERTRLTSTSNTISNSKNAPNKPPSSHYTKLDTSNAHDTNHNQQDDDDERNDSSLYDDISIDSGDNNDHEEEGHHTTSDDPHHLDSGNTQQIRSEEEEEDPNSARSGGSGSGIVSVNQFRQVSLTSSIVVESPTPVSSSSGGNNKQQSPSKLPTTIPSTNNTDNAATATSTKDNTLSATCIAHRFVTKAGVFNTMNIFGASEGQGGENTSTAMSDADNECSVCLESQADTAMFPCRHLCVCMPCAAMMAQQAQTKCPICRDQVTIMLHIKRPAEKISGVESGVTAVNEEVKKDRAVVQQGGAVGGSIIATTPASIAPSSQPSILQRIQDRIRVSTDRASSPPPPLAATTGGAAEQQQDTDSGVSSDREAECGEITSFSDSVL